MCVCVFVVCFLFDESQLQDFARSQAFVRLQTSSTLFQLLGFASKILTRAFPTNLFDHLQFTAFRPSSSVCEVGSLLRYRTWGLASLPA